MDLFDGPDATYRRVDGDGDDGRPSRGRGARARSDWLYAAGAALGMAIVGSSFAVLDTLRDFPQAGGQAARYAVGAALLSPSPAAACRA